MTTKETIQAIENVLDKRAAKGATDEMLIKYLEEMKVVHNTANMNVTLDGFIDAIKQTPLKTRLYYGLSKHGKLEFSETQNFSGTVISWVTFHNNKILTIRENLDKNSCTKEQFEARVKHVKKCINNHSDLVDINNSYEKLIEILLNYVPLESVKINIRNQVAKSEAVIKSLT